MEYDLFGTVAMTGLFTGTSAEDMIDIITDVTGCCGVRSENGKVVSLSWCDCEMGMSFYAPINKYGFCEVVFAKEEDFSNF